MKKTKSVIFLVLQYIIKPEVSSPPCFRIQGSMSVSYTWTKILVSNIGLKGGPGGWSEFDIHMDGNFRVYRINKSLYICV